MRSAASRFGRIWGRSGEVVVFSTGAHSMSGSGYDERLNCTNLNPILASRPTGTPSCGQSVVSFNDSSFASGGYEYGPSGGPYTADATVVDASGAGGSCACSASLPVIGGLILTR